MQPNSPDYETILAHIETKMKAGDSYQSLVAYLEKKLVPQEKAKEIIRTVAAQQKARKEAEAPQRRKQLRRAQVIQSLAQTAAGLFVFITAYWLHDRSLNLIPFVFLGLYAVLYASGLVVIIGAIKTIWMAVRKAEDFDYLEDDDEPSLLYRMTGYRFFK